MSIKVRFAELKDLDFCIEHDFHYVDAFRGTLFMEKYLRGKIEAKELILAEVDGKPVGYLRLEYLWLIRPYLGDIFVNEKYRRKGVGTAMIEFLEEHLVKHKAHKVHKRNGHAFLYSSTEVFVMESQKWHRAVGFEECGIIASLNEGGIGEIFFRKKLEAK